MSHLTKNFVIIAICTTIFGCSSMKDPDSKLAKEHAGTESGYYYNAQQSLKSGQFMAAVEKLNALEERFPFGRYAQQAQLELIYAHFRNQDYAQADAAADHFIRLHPTHSQVDYALYVKGLSAF
ncbi:MAG: outer membrane protein assembly factor BamD, partial [Gammaproteobacteria bacterium]|nr:outer membrane protein assembly factor BamD [Gammaproteobacteria bacterium]